MTTENGHMSDDSPRDGWTTATPKLYPGNGHERDTEDAPGVSDEAVEAAAAAIGALRRQGPEHYYRDARAALEAALPYLAPRPAVDREALVEVLGKLGVGFSAVTPSLYREAVADAVLALIEGSRDPQA